LVEEIQANFKKGLHKFAERSTKPDEITSAIMYVSMDDAPDRGFTQGRWRPALQTKKMALA